MKSAFTSDEWSRRRFMEGTAKTFLGVGALGLTTRGQSALGPNLGIAERAGAAKHVIYLYMNGGMTHLDTFDTKPGHENQGETKTIDTNVDDLKISALLPRLAQQADKLAIVRSLTSTAGATTRELPDAHELRAARHDPPPRHRGLGAEVQGTPQSEPPGSVYIGGDSRINGAAGSSSPNTSPSPSTIRSPGSRIQSCAT